MRPRSRVRWNQSLWAKRRSETKTEGITYLEGTRNLTHRECLLKTLAEHFGGEKRERADF